MALIAHTISTTATTSAINTTGAKHIVVSVSALSSGISLTDSKGNTWQALTERVPASGFPYNRLFYCLSPTVGAGHTFTGSGGGQESVSVIAGDDVVTFQTSTGNSVSGGPTTCQPGSVTPTSGTALFYLSLGHTFQPVSVNSSFTITDQVLNGGSQGNGLAYKSSTTAENPTITLTSADTYGIVTTMAVFLPPPPPTITTPSLPNGVEGIAYSYDLTATSSPAAPQTWSYNSGLTSPSVSVDAAGHLTDSSTAIGSRTVTVSVTDANGATTVATFTYSILPPVLGKCRATDAAGWTVTVRDARAT